MNNWEKTINLLIDKTGTLEQNTWMNKELIKLKKQIQDELRTRK